MQRSDSTSSAPETPKQNLRLLLACPTCDLQFDASNRKPGSTFRCGCGTLITVPEIKKKEDSAVIRCSSCGAPKRGSEDHCTFCGASFTLHEKDLDTICPNCMARISRKARFCHHCGTCIIPNHLRESATEYPCPCCAKQHLNSRKLGEESISVLECPCCGGLWLGHEVFSLLQEKARSRELPWFEGPGQDSKLLNHSKAPGPLYRKCCICGKQMSRRNFAQRSGVIVDICPRDGIWFDQGELERILEKIHSGELSRSLQEAQIRERERDVLNRLKRADDPLERAGVEEFGANHGKGPAPDFLRGMLSFLVDD